MQGRENLDTAYVPCRIFKTISAGQLGVSNNREVSKLFPPGSILTRHGSSAHDLQLLLEEALHIQKYHGSDVVSRINVAMTAVQQRHTYLARLNEFVNYFMR